MARPLNLEVNTSGAWRRVAELDMDRFAEHELHSIIDQLMRGATYDRITARLVIPGDTAPMWIWTRANGWKEWAA